ncbi:hypothetical protein, conserved [Leishmania lindenbergi]|uniref:Uncharacterized protein n=1 Tax=Leishmania lindenbergi TaxID=651832 RepID=A0AAW3AWG0_9TRYP
MWEDASLIGAMPVLPCRMPAETTTTSTGTARHGSRRRAPTYYYQSPSAVVDGDVRFGKGCVVLPHARICVSRGYRLHVGPFCLFEDFAELVCDGAATTTTDQPRAGDAPAPSAASDHGHAASPLAKAVVTLHIGSHNHLHSYARVHCTVAAATPSPPPLAWQLIGRGNVFHAFAAAVLMALPHPSSSRSAPSAPQLQRFLGDYNVVTTHSAVPLPQGGTSTRDASAAAPLAEPDERGGRLKRLDEHKDAERPLAPADPTEGTAAAAMLQRSVASSALSPSIVALPVEPLPGGASADNPLFRSEEDDAKLSGAHVRTQLPPAASLSTPLSPAVSSNAASSAFQHVIFFSSELRTDGAAGSSSTATSAFGVPRFGARSAAELPVVVQRIAEEANAGPSTTAEVARTAALSVKPQPISSDSPSPGSIGAAPPTAAMLEPYISDVHSDLRSHEEACIVSEVELKCRHYIHQLLDGHGLQPVAARLDGV